jgi:hypothetical protein
VRRPHRTSACAGVPAACVLAVGLLAVALATTALARNDRTAGADRASCGGALSRLATLSDPQRSLVNLQPKGTTLAAIAALPQPHPTPRTRNNAFERQVWEVPAQIVRFTHQPNGDIELGLFGDGTYGVAVAPAPACLRATTRDRVELVSALKQILRLIAARSSAGDSAAQQAGGAVAYIAGVGFWDVPSRGATSVQHTAELEPITGIRIVSGCR